MLFIINFSDLLLQHKI